MSFNQLFMDRAIELARLEPPSNKGLPVGTRLKISGNCCASALVN